MNIMKSKKLQALAGFESSSDIPQVLRRMAVLTMVAAVTQPMYTENVTLIRMNSNKFNLGLSTIVMILRPVTSWKMIRNSPTMKPPFVFEAYTGSQVAVAKRFTANNNLISLKIK